MRGPSEIKEQRKAVIRRTRELIARSNTRVELTKAMMHRTRQLLAAGRHPDTPRTPA
ncbi:MAG TPA: hypothetical protein VFL27_14765 [Candidatus Dormibacteraeota bacterium]|nr:hypothetical protein [Candidatus Dormibacteraeota bacterium]